MRSTGALPNAPLQGHEATTSGLADKLSPAAATGILLNYLIERTSTDWHYGRKERVLSK
jgi:hypothetical protein